MKQLHNDISIPEGVMVELSSGYALHFKERTGATFISFDLQIICLSKVLECVFCSEIIEALYSVLSTCSAIDVDALNEALELSDTHPFECMQALLGLSKSWTPETRPQGDPT